MFEESGQEVQGGQGSSEMDFAGEGEITFDQSDLESSDKQEDDDFEDDVVISGNSLSNDQETDFSNPDDQRKNTDESQIKYNGFSSDMVSQILDDFRRDMNQLDSEISASELVARMKVDVGQVSELYIDEVEAEPSDGVGEESLMPTEIVYEVDTLYRAELSEVSDGEAVYKVQSVEEHDSLPNSLSSLDAFGDSGYNGKVTVPATELSRYAEKLADSGAETLTRATTKLLESYRQEE